MVYLLASLFRFRVSCEKSQSFLPTFIAFELLTIVIYIHSEWFPYLTRKVRGDRRIISMEFQTRIGIDFYGGL